MHESWGVKTSKTQFPIFKIDYSSMIGKQSKRF